MKKSVWILILLFTGIFLFAEKADNNVPAKYTREQMNVLANQFKSETGFTGGINYDLNMGVFSGLMGKFANLPVTDTTSAKIVVHTLLGYLQPYMKINQSQLTDWEVDPDDGMSNNLMVIVYQSINGLKFENQAGIVFILSKKNPGEVSIKNSFVPDLYIPPANYITEERAEEIVTSLPGKEGIKIDARSFLLICPISQKDSEKIVNYRPCWRVSTSLKLKVLMYYVDAETGQVIMEKEPLFRE